jgi:hypothetical protein
MPQEETNLSSAAPVAAGQRWNASDKLFGAFLMAGGALWISDGWSLGTRSRANSMFDMLGPDRYLMFLGAILFCIGIALQFRKAEPEVSASPSDFLESTFSAAKYVLLLILYALLLTRAGYAIATLLFLTSMLFLTKRRHVLVTLSIGLLATLLYYGVFVYMSDMPVPRGSWLPQ